jgi:hypothetical protein
MHAPEAIAILIFAELSRGKFTVEQREYMELLICYGLDWYLNPPTAMEYVRNFMELATHLNAEQREEITELAQLQTEMALSKYSLVTVPVSTIAFCAIDVALESLCMNKAIDKAVVRDTLRRTANAIPDFDWASDQVKHTQSKLCQGIAQSFFHLDTEVAIQITDDERMNKQSIEDTEGYYVFVQDSKLQDEHHIDPSGCDEYFPWPHPLHQPTATSSY